MRAWLLLILLAGGSARALELRDARVSSGAAGTRVILELSARGTHRLTALRSPERLVIDIPGAHLRAGKPSRVVGSGPVTLVRLGRRDARNLRVVVELSRRVSARAHLAAPQGRFGYRLIVEIPAAARRVARAAAPAPKPAAMSAPALSPVAVEHAPRNARDLIVAIDAGHGGEDPGATGRGGTREKTVVLAIARELAQRIDAEPGMHAVLTRDGDYFVALRDRMRRARARQADLFVSVHADSIRDPSVSGSSVYILSQRGASDEAARWLAERENAADLVGGVSLEDKDDVLASVLLDLSQTAALSASQAAADSVLHRLVQIGDIRKRQVQQARFVVLKSPDIPSMLVETAYISNPGEERNLRDRAHQGRIAEAIRQGLKDYFYANPPTGTRVAQLAGQKDAAAPPPAVVAAPPPPARASGG